MAGRLVTIATFESQEQAEASKAKLETAGIQATVTNDPPAFPLWSYATTTGDVRLLVFEEVAERAATLLGFTVGADGDLDPEQLAAEAEGTHEGAGFGENAEEAVDEADETNCDRWEARLFACVVFAFLCPPISLLALGLFLKTASMYEQLAREGRIRFYVSGVFTAMALLFWFFVLKHHLLK